MNIKRVKATFLALVVTLMSLGNLVNAAIIDTDEDSFIDTQTGLEWMDFGINNHQSFNEVSSQLGAGGEYEDWRLPSIDEVYTMWHNVANLDEVEADYENLHEYGTWQFNATDYAFQSVWDDIWSILGVNLEQIYDGQYIWSALGFFEGTDGLSFVSYQNRAVVGSDYIRLRDDDNFDYEQDTIFKNWATLLVCAQCGNQNPEPPRRPPVSVTGPNILLILLLGALSVFSLSHNSNKARSHRRSNAKHNSLLSVQVQNKEVQ